MNTLVVLFASIAAVTCNDIKLGPSNGRIIFNETIQASPAIWRQSQKITINATNNEVISSVIVTDNRPEKDGDANIVDGGEGQKNVTVELQSPTVFRGFDFNVVVYAIQNVNAEIPLVSNDTDVKENDARHPILITKDIDINNSAKTEDKQTDVTQDTVSTTEPSTTDSEVTKTGDQTRPYRNTQEDEMTDAVVKYVGGNIEVPAQVAKEGIATEVATTAQDSTTEVNKNAKKDAPEVISFPLIPSIINESQTDKETNIPIFTTDVTLIKDGAINKGGLSSTTGDAAITASTENVLSQYKQKDFDTISEELGQKVVFGIKH